MQKQRVPLELRDLGKQPLSVAELDRLIGTRDHRLFLNPRNELFRARRMREKPPGRAEALRLMAAEPNLLRRPVVVRGSRIVLGYDAAALRRLVSGRRAARRR